MSYHIYKKITSLRNGVYEGHLELEPAMDSKKGVQEKKPALVLKEFLAQKDKGTNDPAAMLRSERYAHATSDDKEARLKSGTIGNVVEICH